MNRNRLIAAASLATVVVEAGWRSGSINTARHAIDLGRPVGVVPGPVTSAASSGCHRILRDWPTTLVTNADEIAELAPLPESVVHDEPAESFPDAPTMEMQRTASRDAGPMSSTKRPRPDPDSTRTRLLDAMSQRTPRDPERIATLSGLATDRVRAELGLLELDGTVRRHPSGWVKVRVS